MTAETAKLFDAEVVRIVNTLRRGGVIVYPTDTLWGIGCDACNESAVERIVKIKKRQPHQSMVILAASEYMLIKYTDGIPDAAAHLIRTSVEPITIIYQKGKNLAGGVCAEDGSVAARIPKHAFCIEVLKMFDRPIVSTSANLSGNAAPKFFEDINKSIIAAADAIADAQCEGKPSRCASHIVKITADGGLQTIR